MLLTAKADYASPVTKTKGFSTQIHYNLESIPISTSCPVGDGYLSAPIGQPDCFHPLYKRH
jgi:hypothetical protein